jgi:4-diphosphocytidyl-2-C-methyl-D-erythritol kinase
MDADLASWPAPAKLNLFLHVTGRRSDGYHLLQTVFQFLDYGDELRFRVRPDGHIRREEGPAQVQPEADLTIRAAQRLRAYGDIEHGADIFIHKKLPMGGGLGGGSSDAATTLVALNALWGLGLDTEILAQIGLELGADVPVFVRGQAAWAEGVGEQLEPVDLPEPWYLVLIPGVEVPTAEIFQAPELTRDSAPIKIADFLSGRGRNDLEAVVAARYPQIGESLAWLEEAAGNARMTGTGACVFAAFGSREQAQAVASQVPERWQFFVARGCNRSPLHDRLDAWRAGRG